MAAGSLFPIESKGEEVVIGLEIHHGYKHVHPSLLNPQLCVLTTCVKGVPSVGVLPRKIVVLPDGGTTEAHPWLDGLDGLVNSLYAVVDVLPSPLGFALVASMLAISVVVIESNGVLGVSDLVQMDSVDVVIGGYFGTDASQVVGCGWDAWIEHPSVGGFHT